MANQTISVQAEPARRHLGSERRAWVRYRCELESYCKPITSATSSNREMGWIAAVRDISAGGIGLTLGRRYERGTVLLLEVRSPHEGCTLNLPVRVVHATAESPGRWIVGCAFARPLSEAELEALLTGE